jgi:hypothetical protein
MDGQRHREPVNDAALEREIESLLASEPSPEFVARVRARVSDEPVAVRWWLQWKAGLAAAAIAAIALVVVWPSRDRQEQSPTLVRPSIERQAPVVVSPPVVGQANVTPRPYPVPRETETARTAALVPVVAEEDARAFDALLAALDDRSVRLVFNHESSAPVVSALAIPPIIIEPLPIALEGGVE